MKVLRSDAKPIDMATAARMHLEHGVSLRAIARQLGIHHTNLMHRFRRYNIPTRSQRVAASIEVANRKHASGPDHYNWKGGFTVDPAGYIVRNSDKKRLHRIIVEESIGRRLKRNESVHHINGDRADNRKSNLLLCSQSFHAWLHAREQGFNIGINNESRRRRLPNV